MISVLNSVSQLNAENALSSTQASLQNTLTQLSTGLKINSGADDPAGLSIAAGLGANIAALTQSSQNASNGVGLLQTADGALSQVTSLLNQAVTLATEAANGQLTAAQSTAADTAYQSILSEITQIGRSQSIGEGDQMTRPSSPWDRGLSSTARTALASSALLNGLVTYAAMPSFLACWEDIRSVRPLQRMTGISGRTFMSSSTRRVPVMPGMIWSVITISKACGSRVNTSRASALLWVAVTS